MATGKVRRLATICTCPDLFGALHLSISSRGKLSGPKYYKTHNGPISKLSTLQRLQTLLFSKNQRFVFTGFDDVGEIEAARLQF